MTVSNAIEKIKNRISPEDRTAFVSAFVLGLLIPIPAMMMI